jgi:hypothetical protein
VFHQKTAKTNSAIDLSSSIDDSLSRSIMGGRCNVAMDSDNLSSVRGTIVESRHPTPSEKSAMEDISQRSRLNTLFNDDKDDRDQSDKESTVSTIDSPFLLSLRHPTGSPPLSPLTGQQYLLNDDEDGDSELADDLEGHVVAGITQYLTTVSGPQESHAGPPNVLGSNYLPVVEMLPSAACSVSTAPSTADEASIGMDSAAGVDYFRLRVDAAAYTGPSISSLVVPQSGHHHRIPSWETAPHQQSATSSNPQHIVPSITRNGNSANSSGIIFDHGGFPPLAPPQIQHAQSTNSGRNAAAHQRNIMGRGENTTSSFRPSSPGTRQQQYNYPCTQQQQHPNLMNHPPPNNSQRYAGLDSHLPFAAQGAGRNDTRSTVYSTSSRAGNSGNPVNFNGLNPYHTGQQNHPSIPQQRKPPQYGQQCYPVQAGSAPARGLGINPGHSRVDSVGGQSASSSGTSPGILSVSASPHRIQHIIQPNTHSASNANQSNAPRSSSEVLKTLLRRKACLYEPDTSRAVALVTWLVGKELALEHGYFSRQQLQAGVHACVTSKIDSGVITRTKVNRCMQIILNSCFHYIIPRPDGTEESGETFRSVFAKEVDESPESFNATILLDMLPQPWREIQVNRDEVLRASSNPDDAASVSHKKDIDPSTPSHSPRLESMRPEERSPGEKHFSVDLSDGFGDTKRAVLLCFNENVRKAEDVFRCHNEFIRDTAHSSNLQLSSHEWQLFFGKEAACSPYLWGNIGIPIPHHVNKFSSPSDALGLFSPTELDAFRTSWCSKRYDHNHELCGFAHTEVNNGWLRRNPSRNPYNCELCPSISSYDKRSGPKVCFIINECANGIDCGFAHSVEEILYHPVHYKSAKTCSFSGRPGGCPSGDVCPNFHPVESYRFPKKTDSRSPRHSRQQQQHAASTSIGGKNGTVSAGSATIQYGAPVLYASPAPISSFENQLLMPGLQALYRRQCSVVRSHIRGKFKSSCSYSYFSDDAGTESK